MGGAIDDGNAPAAAIASAAGGTWSARPTFASAAHSPKIMAEATCAAETTVAAL